MEYNMITPLCARDLSAPTLSIVSDCASNFCSSRVKCYDTVEASSPLRFKSFSLHDYNNPAY